MNGLHPDMKFTLPQHLLQIPEYFESNDVRKPASQFAEEQLYRVLKKVFDTRFKVEKGMSQTELIAYDKILCKWMTPEAVLKSARREAESELAT